MAGWTALALLTAASLNAGPALPAERMAIALKVAGQGLPGCTRYDPAGRATPCFPQFALKPGRAINGWSENGRITLTWGAAARLSDDEFALLAGHEIAHWYLGHQRSSREAELAADRLGAELACAAGFDVERGAGLFRHLRPSRFHPVATIRLASILVRPCAPAQLGPVQLLPTSS